ncbi:putative secreted lipase [Actinoplanes missouriensis 431]|uniref:Putative secreted lipase n=1 Tax=Actinoplanes missouriensis (strain ATCC 14538 / DSM 43046 / CBS 188.64 / JCM 3121 / NBRC 102363 / NCIMB 12654 / NRRL B-3342 / UNCC 431) TaxID=512565 RepID=I0H6V9_ACTM4|nr:lipase family protein [Actinoplanes missouriensis]BAL88746.1 putative secreted lipase [Actinoplanes missouriensis 431]
MPARSRILAALVSATTAAALAPLPAASAHAAPHSAALTANAINAANAANAANGDPVVSRGVTIPAFYTPPTTLPAANGALVRTEPLPLALSLPGITGTLPGRATRIMYKSTDSTGGPVAVTGAYLEPAAAWKGPGARPLVVLAPGTMGQGDQCSTSLALQRGLILGLEKDQFTVSIGYEILAMYRLLAKGIAVVQTDYPGLGTTDRLHTYVNRVDSGHAVLDAARAATALPGTSITAKSAVGFYGYSQGGGAVASAAELLASYAPEIPLKATYAGAPPADLAEVTEAIDGSELMGALGWSVNGFVQSQPALRDLLDAYLNDAGRAALKNLSTMCVGDAIFGYAGKRTTGWTTTGQPVSQIIDAEPELRGYLEAQRIGERKPAGVVRVATGVNDNLVPHGQARTMAADWCGRGGKVVYAPVSLPRTVSPLINHFGPLLTDQGPAIDWLGLRLAGLPAPSTCAILPLQP